MPLSNAFFSKHLLRHKKILCSCLIAIQTLFISSYVRERRVDAIERNTPPEKKTQTKNSGSINFISNSESAPNPQSNPKLSSAASSLKAQEALQVKRITEYWKDGDYALARSQILDFFTKYPHSPARESLLAMLGDLFFQENLYREAVASYQQIKNEALKLRVLSNHAQSLFELENYSALVKLTSEYFNRDQNIEPEKNLKLHLLHAESLFRQMLGSTDPKLQQNFARLAKPHYKILEKTGYEDFSAFPLAEIYRVLKDYQKAAEQYLMLSEKKPANAEELLFQAASLQVKYDKNLAVDTFAKICAMNGKRRGPAAYDLLVLLFQENRYQELIQAQSLIQKHLPKEHLPLLNFYLGKSQFELKNYLDCAGSLEKFVAAVDLSCPKLKSALLTLIVCAEKTQDLALFDKYLQKFITLFPNDAESAKAVAKHAQMAFAAHLYKQAQDDLQFIMDRFPDYQDRESLLFDLALLKNMENKWLESREGFIHFIQEFPLSSKIASAKRLVLDASLKAMQDPKGQEISQLREFLVADLYSILSAPSALDFNEKKECRLLLIKTLIEKSSYEEALGLLQVFIKEYSKDASLSEAHLLTAHCLQKINGGLEEFVDHAEKALALNSQLGKEPNLHFQLFNAYIRLAKENVQQGDGIYSEKAAEHLFQASQISPKEVKKDNLVWLANWYYHRAKEDPVALHRSVDILEDILHINEEGALKEDFFSTNTVELETEVMRMAELLSMQNKIQKRITLLESLIQQQLQHPQLEWKFLRRSLYELGLSYEAVSEQEKALKAYDNLVKTASHAPSHLSNAALLQKTRLQYVLLNENEKNESNPTLIEILNNLKDLQIRKKLYSEPIHLEAALEYADIRVHLSKTELRNDRALFFFKRLREDFNPQSEQLANDSNALRNSFPDKVSIFESYMSYVNAEIQRLEAISAHEGKDDDREKQLKQSAFLQFENLLKNGKTLTPYLRKRIVASIDEIEKTL